MSRGICTEPDESTIRNSSVSLALPPTRRWNETLRVVSVLVLPSRIVMARPTLVATAGSCVTITMVVPSCWFDFVEQVENLLTRQIIKFTRGFVCE